MNNIHHEKATLYLADDLWSYDRIEASDVTWRFEKYAQFPNAARLEYTVRGKKKRQTAMITTIPLVVLDGWDHPVPPPKLAPSKPVTGKGYTTQTTRRRACDPEWQAEFDAFLYGYLAGSKARVLLDLRKHDPNRISQ
ncbi:MAG: hypothetical protein ACLPYZ_18085 [Limisphaerales bacterium]|jgi:hypothetical protein